MSTVLFLAGTGEVHVRDPVTGDLTVLLPGQGVETSDVSVEPQVITVKTKEGDKQHTVGRGKR